MAALVAGLVFVAANTAPTVCAVVHHTTHAASPAGAHGDHGQQHATGAGTTTMHESHSTPSCTDMGHCGVTVHGIAAGVTTVRVAASRPMTARAAPGAGAHLGTFSPPTPPPRA